MGLDRFLTWLTNQFYKYTTNVSYTASAIVTACSTLTLQDWAFVTGIAVAITTCLVNWYYRRKAVAVLKNLHVKKVYEEINR